MANLKIMLPVQVLQMRFRETVQYLPLEEGGTGAPYEPSITISIILISVKTWQQEKSMMP